MKKTVFAVASVVALTACSTTGESTRPRAGNVAYVYVLVNAGKLYAYPEVVTVKNRNTQIVWRLAAPANYTFPDDAIVIEDPQGLGEFDDCSAKVKGKKVDDGYSFICADNNKHQGHKQARHYKYTIKVNGVALPLDPWVVND